MKEQGIKLWTSKKIISDLSGLSQDKQNEEYLKIKLLVDVYSDKNRGMIYITIDQFNPFSDSDDPLQDRHAYLPRFELLLEVLGDRISEVRIAPLDMTYHLKVSTKYRHEDVCAEIKQFCLKNNCIMRHDIILVEKVISKKTTLVFGNKILLKTSVGEREISE